MSEIGFREVFISALLVLLSMGVSRYWRLPVQKDLALGSIRAFVQLIAVGYALQYIFAIESAWLILLAVVVMMVVGAQSVSSRLSRIKHGFVITLASIAAGSVITLGLMLALDIIAFDARYIIPLGGMIIGNSMNASALTSMRIISDVRNHRLAIETSLALGQNWRSATRELQKEAAVAGMLSILNFLKTVGIVALPGAMTGMILAGIDPLEAVLLQILVAFMLVSAVTITSVMALELTIRPFFTSHHQLVLPER